MKLSWFLSAGYPATKVNKKTKRLHQFVYGRYHGPIPPGGEIDHEDRNKLDNVPRNLRAVTHSVNNANGKKRRDNTSGYKGVSWDKRDKKWYAKICKDGKQMNLGLFTDLLDAARAVNAAYREYFPEVAIPNPGVEREEECAV